MKKPTPPRDNAKDDLNNDNVTAAKPQKADNAPLQPNENLKAANDNGHVPPMTEAQAAAYLGLSTDALRNRRHNRRGPRFKNFDGAIRYLKSDLDDYIDGCSVAVNR